MSTPEKRRANTQAKARQRAREAAGVELDLWLDDEIVEVRVRRGCIWGVPCDAEVADVLREDARRV